MESNHQATRDIPKCLGQVLSLQWRGNRPVPLIQDPIEAEYSLLSGLGRQFSRSVAIQLIVDLPCDMREKHSSAEVVEAGESVKALYFSLGWKIQIHVTV